MLRQSTANLTTTASTLLLVGILSVLMIVPSTFFHSNGVDAASIKGK